MPNVLFLQSEVKDPYSFYSRMRSQSPVYYDEVNKIWAVYSYDYCCEILFTHYGRIPVLSSLINEHGELNAIVALLARLNDGTQHARSRAVSIDLLNQWKPYPIPDLIHILAGEPRLPFRIDWVHAICKRLPALYLLKGLGVTTEDALSLLPEVETIVRLMTPVDDKHEVDRIADSVRRVREVLKSYPLMMNKALSGDALLYFANFVGLLIQSFDAGRGLLSHSLLHFVRFPEHRPSTYHGFVRFVRESARFESTVQNTRRYLSENRIIGNHKIGKGENILIVLGSANRDPHRFHDAESFDPQRTGDALSFGAGPHKCIAGNVSIHLAAELLHYLQNKYTQISVEEHEIGFEARINVRLPKTIMVTLS